MSSKRIILVEKVKEMQNLSDSMRCDGKKICFVPTMGYLHEGHLSLMRKGRELGDILVVSIFVNPIQFGPKEDYAVYPRDLERDLRLMEEIPVDVVFYPDVSEMYPEGFQTFVEVEKLSKPLCGKSRPGHFRGVTTVVTKLLNIVKPHVAIFGEKDYQQLKVIERMVKDLNIDVEIVGMPIVREKDGLAMSSRNTYLSEEERKRATSIYRALKKAKEAFISGEKNPRVLEDLVRKTIQGDVEYAEVVDPETLEKIEDKIQENALIAVAVRIGKTRLIDNTLLGG